ncbi:unnamed protein product, partial [Rotaria sp. Silwood2]
MTESKESIRLKESRSLSMPIPAPQKCRSTGICETDQNSIHLPQFIPYCILRGNIIWLDLFANERDLSFTQHMVAANRLHIFSTASDCVDFLDSFSSRLYLTSSHGIYSAIVSGVYATNGK